MVSAAERKAEQIFSGDGLTDRLPHVTLSWKLPSNGGWLCPRRGLTRFALLCGQCSCGCPELFVDHDAPPERTIVITDDFGQRVQMSADQFAVLIEEARSGRLDEAVADLTAR